MEVRRLGPDDAAAVQRLRRRALEEEPLSFGTSPHEDRVLDDARVVGVLTPTDDAAVFGAFEEDELRGLVGVLRPDKEKLRHRAEVWGTYVAPEGRRRGLGRALMDALIDWSRAAGATHVFLGVTAAAPEARALYESVGFVCWGIEPASIRHGDRNIDSYRLVLVL